MNVKELSEKLSSVKKDKIEAIKAEVSGAGLSIYNMSVQNAGGNTYFIARNGIEKCLYIISASAKVDGFEGSVVASEGSLNLIKCEFTTANRKALQGVFNWLVPVVLGTANSIGCGDRIGLANAGHIRALDITDFRPILAQQSIRELTRTHREADEVMDCAVWAVFQEGWEKGFGADADHLKTPDDIDYMVKAGYRLFTFDPGEHVDNEADDHDLAELKTIFAGIDWGKLYDSPEKAAERYIDKTFSFEPVFSIHVSEKDFYRAYAKYGKALIHVKKMYDYLKSHHKDYSSEVEISVDETESVTSPFEHFFFASELNRMGVVYVSLAPRFVGDFEKGIDYKGDIDLFTTEYKKHIAISESFGDYKISLHSGSDKFTVYKAIGKLKIGQVHVKTAGTSYLEALKVLAMEEPDTFRTVLNYCRGLYETEKKTYHVSADINKVKPAESYSDKELVGLWDSNDVRQVLHVTFGRVVTDKDASGKYIFKDLLLDCLKKNEETHYSVLINHFHNHLSPFN